jgi:hypothetical protein
MFTLRCSVVVFAFALLLSACGGSQQSTETGEGSTPSSSTEASTTTKSTDEPTTLEGRAVKGLVLNAQLDAYILENGSRRHVGSTQTDDQGHFSLQLSDSSGPLVIEMTPAGDGSSTMICDAVDGCGSGSVDFGQEFPLPTDFLISTLIIPSDDTSEVSLTPLTHVAAEWAQAMPGEVSGQKVELARARVAGVFQIDTAFPFHDEPDLTDPQSLDGADEASARHSLISAAFLERAADTGDTLQDVIDGYAQSLAAYAGQIENHGTYSLYSLFDAAYEIADTQNILPDIRSSLDLQIAGLSSGVTTVTTSASYDQNHYDNALATLDDLDHYLNQAGIDSSGSFLADQSSQVSWLETESTIVLDEIQKNITVMTTWASIMAGTYEDAAEKPSPIDFMAGQKNISAVYDFDTKELTWSGNANGHTVNLTIDITPVVESTETASFSATGTVENDDSVVTLDEIFSLDFRDTDISNVVSAFQQEIQSGAPRAENLADEIKTMLPNLNFHRSTDSNSSIAQKGDSTHSFDLNDYSGWINRNLSALTESGALITKEISTGELVTPAGDRISDNEESAAPALSIKIGDQSHIEADFVTEAFGLPRMEVEMQGTIPNTASLTDQYKDKFDAFMEGEFSLQALTEILPEINYGALNLSATGDIKIEDTERGTHTYGLNLSENSVSVSRPNSTENAFIFHKTEKHGGYITSGNTVIATVTMNKEEQGAALYLVDGTERSYYLGPMTDFMEKKFLDLL